MPRPYKEGLSSPGSPPPCTTVSPGNLPYKVLPRLEAKVFPSSLPFTVDIAPDTNHAGWVP